jgi:hypothetical protein
VPELPSSLQQPLQGIFERLLQGASATAARKRRGVDEVDWIEKFHALIGVSLAQDVRATMRAADSPHSVAVQSALLHGNPFQVRPTWSHAGTIEIGDLLFVSDVVEQSGHFERQALLLQMKVGKPKIGTRVVWTTAQAKLYATWPPITWSDPKTLRGLPRPFPRTPAPGACRAAQFGVIPSFREARQGREIEALPPFNSKTFRTPTTLSSEIATTFRLDLGIDATPNGGNGWPRIVEDMLRAANLRDFRGAPRLQSGYRGAVPRPRGRTGGAGRPFLAVQALFGPPGWFD